MGKFYFANKHKWFRHRAEKAHKQKLAAGGTLVAAGTAVDVLRFVCNDGSTPPKNLRISDHNQAQMAVIGANGYIGHLDDESTKVMRRFFVENPELANECPAYIEAPEDWSGAYLVRLGFDPRPKKK